MYAYYSKAPLWIKVVEVVVEGGRNSLAGENPAMHFYVNGQMPIHTTVFQVRDAQSRL